MVVIIHGRIIIMPNPIPEGTNFYIKHRLMPADYKMPFLQMNRDFYSMGYHISGDRTTITPTMTYTQGAGSLGTVPPLRYHQTFPASDKRNESILLKFNSEFIKPFTDIYGEKIMDIVYAYPSNVFDEKHTKQVEQLLFDMIEVFESDSEFKTFTLQCMLFQLFILIIDYRIPNKITITYKNTLSKEITESVCFIESHYNEHFSIDYMAEMVGFSASHFSRVFKSQTGHTYSDYLNMVRIHHAKALLTNTTKSVTQIALETGFSYPGKLTEVFKKREGMTPLNYRKNITT